MTKIKTTKKLNEFGKLVLQWHSKHKGSVQPATGAAVFIACRQTERIINKKIVIYLDLKTDHPPKPLPVSISLLCGLAPTEQQRRKSCGWMFRVTDSIGLEFTLQSCPSRPLMNICQLMAPTAVVVNSFSSKVNCAEAENLHSIVRPAGADRYGCKNTGK